MALNTEYITTIKLPPSEFDVNHPNDILEYLSEHLSKDKGNVVRLYDVKKEKDGKLHTKPMLIYTALTKQTIQILHPLINTTNIYVVH